MSHSRLDCQRLAQCCHINVEPVGYRPAGFLPALYHVPRHNHLLRRQLARSAYVFAFAPRCFHTRPRALGNQLPLEFGERSQNVEIEPAFLG